MRPLVRHVIALSASLALIAPACGQAATLPVLVHEPLELLCVVARFAGNPEYQRHRSDPAYGRAAERHFDGAKDHAVVTRLRELRQSHGISYDAIAGLAVHLGPMPDLAPRTSLSPRPPMLDARWEGADVEGFVAMLRQFAVASEAAKFFATHADLYREAEARLSARLSQSKALPWFDAFFGKREGALCVPVAGLLCGGNNFGVSVQHTDGKPDELRPVFGCWNWDAAGKPEFGEELLPLFVHELCHSYTNVIVDRHFVRLQKAGDALFAAKATAMRRQAYSNGRTVLCETFVRACVIRCVADTEGKVAGRQQAAAEAKAHFPWAAEIAVLLGEYQQSRDRFADFDAFVPRIADALDAIAVRLEATAAAAPKLVATMPAIGAKDVDPTLVEMTFTFDRAMRDQSWSVVGAAADTPKVVGAPKYDAARRVLTIPVQLEAGRTYRFGLNSEQKQGFQSEAGVPLEPVAFEFSTAVGR